MTRRVAVALAFSTVAALAGAAAPAPDPAPSPTTATEPAEPTPQPGSGRWVVVQDKTPLMFGNEQIGQLAEGTRVTLVRAATTWSQVRASFGDAWVQGWLRTPLIQPDSLQRVGVRVGHASLQYSYERKALPGLQFLIVPVQFAAQEGGPTRLYFDFADLDSADVVLGHSQDKKLLPYGYLRPKPLSEQRELDTHDRRQVLALKPDKPLVETYIFAVPVRARGFVLLLKDTKHPIRIRR